MISTSVFAEWTKVGSFSQPFGFDDGRIITYSGYVDLSSMKKNGDKVTMLNLIDYEISPDII